MTSTFSKQISLVINCKLWMLFFLTYLGKPSMFYSFQDNVNDKRSSNVRSYSVLSKVLFRILERTTTLHLLHCLLYIEDRKFKISLVPYISHKLCIGNPI